MREIELMKKLRKKKQQLTHLPEDVLEVGKKAGKKAFNVVGEFKEFISRGNVTDLAIGVVVGTSFTAIVNSLANNVLMPLIGVLMGGIDLTNLSFTVNSLFFENSTVTVEYGFFLQAIVNFFIIAVSVFFMVKILNAVRRKKEEEEPVPDPQIELLTEIRDLLRKNSRTEDPSPTEENDLSGSKLPD
jgi:large conductance mechanosensitive channel